MAASNLHEKESADAPPRVRSGLRSRRSRVASLVIGVVAGLILVLVLMLGPYDGRLPADTGADPQGGAGASLPASLPPSLPTSAGSTLFPRTGVGPIPAALDAEWAGYSDRSTCGDWAGGDGISAVRLSASQIAWFFSDSYLGPARPESGFSQSAGLVHNSVVIQTMSGQGSRFVTLTGGGVCSSAVRPAAVISPPQAPGGHSTRYWAEDGITLGDTIIKFYNSYRPGNAPYIPTGTVLAIYSASQLGAAASGPSVGGVVAPQLIPLPSYVPPGGNSPIVWGASVLRAGSMAYIYGTQMPNTPVPFRQLYLARVPVSQLTQFSAWQFYAGSGHWTASQPAAQPLQPAESSLSVSSGFSVVHAGQRYWLIQADPIAGSQDIDAYPATSLWGPFDQSAGIVLYRDPGIGLDTAHDFRIMYEARAELAVSTSHELVISYNINSIGNTAGCIPMSWFTNTVTLPRFIAVPLTLLSGAGSGGAGGGPDDVVTAGPPSYPQIAQRAPAQWFNEWNYPGDGCPRVPGVTSVQAMPQAGAVSLSWPNAGLGVAYRVYLRSPGTTGYTLNTTVSFVLSTTARISAALSGLAPGKYVAKVVPVNLRQQTGHVAQVSFTVPGG
jgi:hypothetical protein